MLAYTGWRNRREFRKLAKFEACLCAWLLICYESSSRSCIGTCIQPLAPAIIAIVTPIATAEAARTTKRLIYASPYSLRCQRTSASSPVALLFQGDRIHQRRVARSAGAVRIAGSIPEGGGTVPLRRSLSGGMLGS